MSIRVPISKPQLEELIGHLWLIKQGLDFLGDHVVITDENANILYANKAVETNTGFSAKEIMGKNPADLWGGKMPKDFYEKMWHTIKEEKKPFVGEVQNIRKDGTTYWQELHISPVLNDKGEIRFFIGVEPNITDRKEKEKFKEEFIGIVGHQLRNPLESIGWMIDWFSKNTELPEENRKKLGEIYKENKNLADFVHDLLILSRVGKSDLKKETFDLKAELERIINEVKQKNSNVNFIFEIKGSDFSLMANKTMAEQVFTNLIYNAAEYSNKDSGKVDIVLERNENGYLFSVHNNGPEIAEEDKLKIFGKFFRSEMAQKMKSKGSGLGLFIIKMICDDFGWEIWFDSCVGQGTTFYVKIPVKNKLN